MPSNAIDYQLTLKIDGVPLASQNMDEVVEVTVDTDLYLPAMAMVTLLDTFDQQKDSASYIDGKTFKIGKKLAISVKKQVEDDSASGQIFDGEITSVEPLFGEDGKAFLRVYAYDKCHRLMRGKHTRTFGSGQAGSISEKDIINQILQGAGLTAEVDASLSNLRYSYLMQYNQTDWEFLMSRAKLYGCQLYADGFKGCFKKANTPRGTIAAGKDTLKWGETLTTFEPRVSLMSQISETGIYGWDPMKKAGIVSKATDGPNSVVSQTAEKESSAALKSAFGSAQEIVLDTPIPTTGVAEVIAKARYGALEDNYITARGTIQYGNPFVQAGYKVKIEGVGKRFKGTYFITKARHIFVGGNYVVQFEAAGSGAHDLFSLLNTREDSNLKKINTPVVGVVTSLSDPEKLGRVKVKFPWIPAASGGAELESNWARVASPGAGINRGLLFMPQVNDEVLVMFEHGDINYPYIVGGLWNKKDPAPKGTSSEVFDGTGTVNQRVIRSTSGHLIILDDTKGEEKITIQDKSGENSIIIDSKTNAMTLTSKGDFTVDAGGKFIVKSKADATIEATGNVKVSSKQGFTLEAIKEAVLKVSSNQVAVKIAGVELTGMKVDIKSNTMASISGSAVVEVKGAIVKIN